MREWQAAGSDEVIVYPRVHDVLAPPELEALWKDPKARQFHASAAWSVFATLEPFDIALAKRYGPVALEDAAKAALELRVLTYRFLRRYLERRPPLTLRQVDPLIRQLTVYRDLIDRTTGDPT